MRVILQSWVIGFVLVATVYPQQAKSFDGKLPGVIHRMENGDLATREAAFDELMTAMAADKPRQSPGSASLVNGFLADHPEHADQVKLGLIHLLTRENYLFVEDKNPADYDEGNSEHYAQLIDVVSSLDDERAIPALVGAMTTGGIATRGLLKYGDKALGPVLDELKNPNQLLRASALGVAVTILKTKGGPGSAARITDLLQSSFRDAGSAVREEAVMLIGCLENRREFVPTLEKIAKTDPENYPGAEDDGVDGDKFYPVRVDARRVLRDIQNNKKCTP